MATYIYLADETGQTRRIGVDDNGRLKTDVAAGSAASLVLVGQPTAATYYSIGIDVKGVLTRTPTELPGQVAVALWSPSEIGYWFSISDAGVFEINLMSDPTYGLAPKIVYPSGGGTTLFVEPAARLVPAFSKKAVRHDSYSTAGIRESVLERIDNFLQFTVEWLKAGSQAAGWTAFADYSLAGEPFDYYPCRDLPYFATYLLDSDEFEAAYKNVGRYTLSPRFRLRIT
jgi:hypothetical protein